MLALSSIPSYFYNTQTALTETTSQTSPVAIPLPQKQDPTETLRSIKLSNIFPTHKEKNLSLRMGMLAQLMYDYTPKNLALVSMRFPHGLVPLPSPESLGIKLPNGVKFQAFRHGNEVIIAFRGTALQETGTAIANLIADVGIGRHKTNEDLKNSLNKTEEITTARHGYTIPISYKQMIENVLEVRVLGHTTSERTWEMGMRIASSAWESAKTAAKRGGLGTGTLALGGMALSLTNPFTATALTVCGTLSSSLIGAAYGSTSESLKCATVMDGYENLLSYVSAADAYITKLKADSVITKDDTVITTGHSLGGYLAGVIGALHGDEAYSYNGPGVLFKPEMEKIIANLGVERTVNEDVIYHSILMEGDFIGNLGSRGGTIRTLALPHVFEEATDDFPKCVYNNPLAHHGIQLINSIIKNSMVLEIPRSLTVNVQMKFPTSETYKQSLRALAF